MLDPHSIKIKTATSMNIGLHKTKSIHAIIFISSYQDNILDSLPNCLNDMATATLANNTITEKLSAKSP